MSLELERGIAQFATFDAVQALVGQVAQARGELQAQQIEERKHNVRVAVRVGGVLQQRQFRFVAQHFIQRISGVA
jgi:hypothetical protein